MVSEHGPFSRDAPNGHGTWHESSGQNAGGLPQAREPGPADCHDPHQCGAKAQVLSEILGYTGLQGEHLPRSRGGQDPERAAPLVQADGDGA